MRLIGLTGGTGSGKSTAAEWFSGRKVPVIDADRIGHDLIAPGGAAEHAVLETFGEGILTSGIIDRAKLGAAVFGDPVKLSQLNGIVHPLLFGEIARRCQEHAAEGADFVIIDAALLAEAGERDAWLNELILVSAPEAIRVARLVEGRGMAPQAAWQRVRAQRDPEAKRVCATWVVDNAGGIGGMHRQLEQILEALRGPRPGTS